MHNKTGKRDENSEKADRIRATAVWAILLLILALVVLLNVVEHGNKL